MHRVAPVAVLAGALAADSAGGHALAFYLVLAAIALTAHAALDAYGTLVDLPGRAPGLAVARAQAILAVIALALALLAAAVRAPALGEASVPALGLSALVGAFALLLANGVLRLAR
jgi:hypothetical protein